MGLSVHQPLVRLMYKAKAAGDDPYRLRFDANEMTIAASILRFGFY